LLGWLRDALKSRWVLDVERCVVCLALAQSGCVALAKVDAGYAHAFSQAPERSAAAFNAYFGIGVGGDNGGAGPGVGLRGKASDAVGQFSFTPMIFGVVGPRYAKGAPPYAFYGLGGASLLTIESVAGKGSVSLGSPFVEGGVFVHVYDIWGITLGVNLEEDVRFNELPNTSYVSLVLGLGSVDYSDLHLR
jgi:hypothetical protein